MSDEKDDKDKRDWAKDVSNLFGILTSVEYNRMMRDELEGHWYDKLLGRQEEYKGILPERSVFIQANPFTYRDWKNDKNIEYGVDKARTGYDSTSMQIHERWIPVPIEGDFEMDEKVRAGVEKLIMENHKDTWLRMGEMKLIEDESVPVDVIQFRGPSPITECFAIQEMNKYLNEQLMNALLLQTVATSEGEKENGRED